jgi:hypothetical protein
MKCKTEQDWEWVRGIVVTRLPEKMEFEQRPEEIRESVT